MTNLSWRERLATLILGEVPENLIRRERSEAYKLGFREAIEFGPDDEPALYTADGRPISTGYSNIARSPRDLSQWSQDKALQAIYRLWNTNPLAGALTEIIVDYVIGDGMTVEAFHPDVQQALDRFWNDPVNNFGEDGLDMIVRELSLFGEQLFLLFPRVGEDTGAVADGLLRIATIDPSSIYSVISDIHNPRDLLAVRLKGPQGTAGLLYKIVKLNLDTEPEMFEGRINYSQYKRFVENSLRTNDFYRILESGQEWKEDDKGRPVKKGTVSGKYDGECMLFQINRLSTGTRGRPDLLRMIDWLDRLDQLFFDGAEHAALLNMFVWDLLVEGGSEDDPLPERNLRYQARKVSRMKPNSIYSHNERVKLEPKNPDLKSADLETLIRQLRIFVAGGARVPEHWIAEGGYTNRATATEMGRPTYRMLQRRQSYIASIMRRLCQYQLDILIGLGHLPEMVDVVDIAGKPTGKQVSTRKAFQINVSDVNIIDTEIATKALRNVADAVLALVGMNLLPKKDALRVIAEALSLFNIHLDVTAVLQDLGHDELSK